MRKQRAMGCGAVGQGGWGGRGPGRDVGRLRGGATPGPARTMQPGDFKMLAGNWEDRK